ncbi:hypothetical protein [Paenibacillus methanolicus]|uniref:Uncharacterized protein n=1 Tax=Paenibacillus methanolicus TaxID=582686 RepID=A0A5S5CAI2_9BACL|nr:hypothetical protein [Paenibacillus methanolicus]TYP76354.1 hypothetical protein BCM02_10315 [Paenibacillus methanolicus]
MKLSQLARVLTFMSENKGMKKMVADLKVMSKQVGPALQMREELKKKGK